MKIEIPQILWHNGSESDNGKNAPLYSLTCLECTEDHEQVLATAGNTSEIYLWRVSFAHVENKRILQNQSSHQINHLFSLCRHDRSVNAVKFSPDGLVLCTGGDGGSIILWCVAQKSDWCQVEKETDLKVKILSACSDGICDISWSSDSKSFVAGSIDHTVMVYQMDAKGNYACVYRNTRDHTAYVQGVAYDPLGLYVSSMGSDRTVRVYQKKTNKKKKKTDSTSSNPSKLDFCKTKTLKHFDSTKKQYLFADETTVESFFRRLSWTHDGAFLITPSALFLKGEESSFGTHVFARHCFDQPYKVLAGLEKPSVAIRPNPIKFELPKEDENKENDQENVNKTKSLPYRSIFCVLTIDTVLLYDTHHTLPLCIARGLHFASLTDAAWSADGRRLFVSSTDGYISILSFDQGELGQVYHEEVSEPLPQVVAKETTLATLAKKQQPQDVLVPPCEPGQTATIVAPPAKRLKVTSMEETVGAAVTNLSIHEPPKKKKKRITPILVANNV